MNFLMKWLRSLTVTEAPTKPRIYIQEDKHDGYGCLKGLRYWCCRDGRGIEGYGANPELAYLNYHARLPFE